jgi:hypothetical protein
MTITLLPDAVRPRDGWEYWRLPITNAHDANLAALNELGSQGWELVNVSAMHYWLKRRIYA